MKRNYNQGIGGRTKPGSEATAGLGKEGASNSRGAVFVIKDCSELEEQACRPKWKAVNPEKGDLAVNGRGRPAAAGRGAQTGTRRGGNSGSARELTPQSNKTQSHIAGTKAAPHKGIGERGRRRIIGNTGKLESDGRGTGTRGSSSSVDRESESATGNVKLKATTQREKLRNSGQEIVGGGKTGVVQKKTRSQATGIEKVKSSESSRPDEKIRSDSATLRDCRSKDDLPTEGLPKEGLSNDYSRRSGNMGPTSWPREEWVGVRVKTERLDPDDLSDSLVANLGYRDDSSLEPVDVSDMIKFSSDEEDTPLDPEQGPPLDRKQSDVEAAVCAAEPAPPTLSSIKTRLDRCRENINAFTAQKRHIDDTVDRRFRLCVAHDIDAVARRNLAALLRLEAEVDEDLLEDAATVEGFLPGEYVPRKWDASTAHLLPPDPADAAVFTEFDGLYALAKAGMLARKTE